MAKKNIEISEAETFTAIKRSDAPANIKVKRDPNAGRKARFEGYITYVRDAGEGAVGSLELEEDESYRAYLLNLASAAKRQGVGIEAWTADDNRTVFFELV